MNEQKQIYQHVVDHGYREGWTAGQFFARNVCKLLEELAELSYYISSKFAWVQYLYDAGWAARSAFDCRSQEDHL